MGWSVPQAKTPEKPLAWSPWICVFIVVLGYTLALVWVIFDAPSTGLYPLSSGHYLPLTGFTLAGVMSLLALYLVIWETRALSYNHWTHWQANTYAEWQNWAHQHLYLVESINLSAIKALLPHLAGLSPAAEEDDEPSVLLFPDESIPPGIYRFEAISRHLLGSLHNALHALPLSKSSFIDLYVQTQTAITDAHSLYLDALWRELYPDYNVRVKPIDARASLESWQPCLSAQHAAIVLALHYYDGIVEKPIAEIATALLLVPARQLKPEQRKNASRLFRAMPVDSSKLTDELQALRDMTQQPIDALRLLWFSGLSDAQRQTLNVAVHDLQLPLRKEAPMGGQLDFDKGSAQYGPLAGWLMVGAAAEMLNHGQGSQWVVAGSEHSAWAMALGKKPPLRTDYHHALPNSPYPAGCIMTSLLVNLLLFWSVGYVFPDWLFSSWGLITVLLMLTASSIGCVIGLRLLVSRLLEPRFIQSTQQQGL